MRNMNKAARHLARLATVLLSLAAGTARAEKFLLPADNSDLIGEIRYAPAYQKDTLIDVARRFSVGQDEMVMANPDVDRWLPGEGTRVLIPRRFVLPDAPRVGIVVNIPEMRLYYYPVKYAAIVKKKPAPPKAKPGAKGKAAPPPKPVETSTEVGEPLGKAAEVITYPISIGRMDWKTPLGKTRVIQKVKDPVWIPPESIKKEHAKDGDFLPDVVPAGPDNPLGQFALRLGVPGYLIHGTDTAKSDGIGMRATHGCIRMYPEDVSKLFQVVAVGTPVHLVNQPVKLGWQGGVLYMEVHQPLDEDAMSANELLKLAIDTIRKETEKHPILIDQEAVKTAVARPSGLPVEIGKEELPLEAAPAGSEPGAPPSYYPAPEQPPTYGRPTAPPAPPEYPSARTPPPSYPAPEQPPAYGQPSEAPPPPAYPSYRTPPAPRPPAAAAPEAYPPAPEAAVPEPRDDGYDSASGQYESAPDAPTYGQYASDPWEPPPSGSAQDAPDPYAPDESVPDPYSPEEPSAQDQ